MNNIDFTQTGGLPFDQSLLKFLQDNTAIVAQIAAICGPLAIVSGCVVTGPNASDGYVVINGEVLPFVGGAITAKVIVNETVTALMYQDEVARDVKTVRWATFGDDGITDYEWVNFKRNTDEGVFARLEGLEAAQGLPLDNTDDYTPTLPYHPATKKYVDDRSKKVLASGTVNIGTADTNHSSTGEGTVVSIPFGFALADTNYMAFFTVLSSAADPFEDLYHSVSLRTKTVNDFKLYFRLVAAPQNFQNVAVDYVVYAK